VRRLYPAILVGLLLAVALHLAFAPPDDLLWVKLVLAGAMIPFPMGNIFPLNAVQWSLLFELIANAMHATIPPEAARVVPPVLMVVGGACLLAAFVSGTTIDGGNMLGTLWVGLGRALFSFFAGVTLCGLHQRGVLSRIPNLPTPLVIGVFLLALALPVMSIEALRQLLTIVVLWPLVLVLALCAPEPSGWFAVACQRLGWVSYPIYATHMPILEAMRPLVRAWGWPATMLSCCLIAAAAVAIARLAEPPPRPQPRMLPVN